MNRTQLKEYLETLVPEMRALYEAIEADMTSYADTLDEEFQILAGMVEVFWDRARAWFASRGPDAPPSPGIPFNFDFDFKPKDE